MVLEEGDLDYVKKRKEKTEIKNSDQSDLSRYREIGRYLGTSLNLMTISINFFLCQHTCVNVLVPLSRYRPLQSISREVGLLCTTCEGAAPGKRTFSP